MWTEIVIGTAAAVYFGVRAAQVLNEDRGCEVGKAKANEDDLVRFALLVNRMRAAQAHYFKTHDNSDLAQAKALEKRVDEAVSWVLKHRQPGIIKGPGHDHQNGDGAYPKRRGPDRGRDRR